MKKTGEAKPPTVDLQPLEQSWGTIAGKVFEVHHSGHVCGSAATGGRLSVKAVDLKPVI
ncbi:MAG: hypothetical protein GY702_10170 [Desulfobulbaceae bacterium]|nr:hypothetical protein [Desulfobulbaceae bacterium]